MPITKSEFEKGRSEDPIIHRIQGFLESSKDNAYTEEEIMKHMYPEHIAWPGDTIAFNSAMLILAYAEMSWNALRKTKKQDPSIGAFRATSG